MMEQWNSDMDAAPKDGTLVDLWVVFPGEGEGRWADSHWDDKRQDWKGRGGFVLGQYAAKPYATHWMPPPPPPSHSV
ncbi:hypothetical protein ABIC65_001118 [Sphingomonas trueperi]